MVAITFDTLAYAHRLKAAGVTDLKTGIARGTGGLRNGAEGMGRRRSGVGAGRVRSAADAGSLSRRDTDLTQAMDGLR